MIFMSAMAWWSGTYALFWLGAPAPTHFFWLDITYIGVVIAPAALLAFSLEYTGQGDRLTPGFIFLLAIEPLVTLLLLLTDPLHDLFFAGQRNAKSGAILAGGPAFWFNVLYCYSVILIACIVLVRAFLHAPALYRRQAALVLGAVMVPWVSNFLSLSGLSPFAALDLTPLAFTLSGLLLATALIQYRFLDIAPVARDLLVENMSDGVLVLDELRRIVDINPAMQRLLALPLAESIGQELAVLQPHCPALLRFCEGQAAVESAISLAGAAPRYVDLQQLPITDRRGHRHGMLIIARDVTVRKLLEEERERTIAGMQDALAQVKTLRGLLHTCAQCKKIRDENGAWLPLDFYVRTHTDAEFSHGLCPDCMRELYPELYALREAQKQAILDFLGHGEGGTLDALSDAIGLSKPSTLRRLESLIVEGGIEEVEESGVPVFRTIDGGA